jgi:hypothetical protein
VIIYSGRTGSSPIVNILARQPGICVPVFENLDRRFVGAARVDEIPAILDRVLTTGELEGARLPEHLPRFPAEETPSSIGFKWRPFGDWAKTCEVFRRHDVMLFVLTRRDFVELASSLYITSHGNALQSEVKISTHPQFGLAIGARAAAEREAIERLQNMTFPARPRLLYRVMRHQADMRRRLLDLAADAHRLGVPVRSILYEDFTADNAGFIRGLLAEIGLPAASVDTSTVFEKVMKVPAKSRLDRLGRWLWLPPLRMQMLRYDHYGRGLDAIGRASRDGGQVRPRQPIRGPVYLGG